jgi:hypothetical protein
LVRHLKKDVAEKVQNKKARLISLAFDHQGTMLLA